MTIQNEEKNGTAIAVAHAPVAAPGMQFTDDQIELLKRTVCKGATTDEFKLFAYQCQRTGLDPFARQIHAVKRKSRNGTETMAIQTGIDGYRLIAQRSGEYEGQTKVEWCDADGNWRDVWLSNKAPAAARVGIYRKGFKEPVYAVALWTEYVQTDRDGKTTAMWQKMGALMLAKCAEALALRKAFPQELSGIYTNEEMQQADAVAGVEMPEPKPTTPIPTNGRFEDTVAEVTFVERKSKRTGNPFKVYTVVTGEHGPVECFEDVGAPLEAYAGTDTRLRFETEKTQYGVKLHAASPLAKMLADAPEGTTAVLERIIVEVAPHPQINDLYGVRVKDAVEIWFETKNKALYEQAEGYQKSGENVLVYVGAPTRDDGPATLLMIGPAPATKHPADDLPF